MLKSSLGGDKESNKNASDESRDPLAEAKVDFNPFTLISNNSSRNDSIPLDIKTPTISATKIKPTTVLKSSNQIPYIQIAPKLNTLRNVRLQSISELHKQKLNTNVETESEQEEQDSNEELERKQLTSESKPIDAEVFLRDLLKHPLLSNLIIVELAQDGISLFMCQKCFVIFTSFNGLQAHRYSCYVSGPKLTEAQKLSNCSICYNQVVPKLNGIRHRCVFCNATDFTNCRILTRHILDMHNFMLAVCEYCNKIFTNPLAINEHLKSLHVKGDNTSLSNSFCDICQKILTSEKALERHKMLFCKKLQKDPYCTKCLRSFVDYETLRSHLHRFNKGKLTDDAPREFSLECISNCEDHTDPLMKKLVLVTTCEDCGEGLLRKGVRSSNLLHTCSIFVRFVCTICQCSSGNLKELKHHISSSHVAELILERLEFLTEDLILQYNLPCKKNLEYNVKDNSIAAIPTVNLETVHLEVGRELEKHIHFKNQGTLTMCTIRSKENEKSNAQNGVPSLPAGVGAIQEERVEESPEFDGASCLTEWANAEALAWHYVRCHSWQFVCDALRCACSRAQALDAGEYLYVKCNVLGWRKLRADLESDPLKLPNKPYCCRKCGYTFNSSEKLSQHCTLQHAGDVACAPTFKCRFIHSDASCNGNEITENNESSDISDTESLEISDKESLEISDMESSEISGRESLEIPDTENIKKGKLPGTSDSEGVEKCRRSKRITKKVKNIGSYWVRNHQQEPCGKKMLKKKYYKRKLKPRQLKTPRPVKTPRRLEPPPRLESPSHLETPQDIKSLNLTCNGNEITENKESLEISVTKGLEISGTESSEITDTGSIEIADTELQGTSDWKGVKKCRRSKRITRKIKKIGSYWVRNQQQEPCGKKKPRRPYKRKLKKPRDIESPPQTPHEAKCSNLVPIKYCNIPM